MNSLSTISLNPINPDARRFLLVVADAVAPEFPEVVVMPVSRRRFEEGAPYFNTLTRNRPELGTAGLVRRRAAMTCDDDAYSRARELVDIDFCSLT